VFYIAIPSNFVNFIPLIQGWTNFLKIYTPPQNSWRQKDGMKQAPLLTTHEHKSPQNLCTFVLTTAARKCDDIKKDLKENWWQMLESSGS
jgi:hypothetical protein